MPLRPSTRTYGQLKTTVRRVFGDEAAVQIADSDILQWVNDGLMAIVEKNKNLKAVSTTPSVVGQQTYDFPTPLISQVEAITYDNQPLQNLELQTAFTTIQESDPQATQQGCPLVWYEWAGQFKLYPVPDAVKDITLYYTRYPDLLDDTSTDATVLDAPDKYFQALVDFCLWKCYELDETWDAAQIKEGHFRAALEDQSEEEREQQHLTYPVIQDVMW